MLRDLDIQKLEKIISDAMYECVFIGVWSAPNFDYESVAKWALDEIAKALREAGLGEVAVSKVVEKIRDDMYHEAYNCAIDGYYSGNGAVNCDQTVKELTDKVKNAISEAVKAQNVGPRLKV